MEVNVSNLNDEIALDEDEGLHWEAASWCRLSDASLMRLPKKELVHLLRLAIRNWSGDLHAKDRQANTIRALQGRIYSVILKCEKSRFTRPVKNRGMRLFIDIDGFECGIRMDRVVEALNSFGAIIDAAKGESL